MIYDNYSIICGQHGNTIHLQLIPKNLFSTLQLTHNKYYEATNRIIHNYVKQRNRGPSTCSTEQNTAAVQRKHPQRLVFWAEPHGLF